MTRRRTAVVVAAGMLLWTVGVNAAPAAAAPSPGTGMDATGTAPVVDNTRWPAELNWVIPGTAEFTDRYLSGATVGGLPAGAGGGCTAEQGGDAWAYTRDFFTELGAVLDAQAGATGQPVLAFGGSPVATAPWPGLATDRGVPVLTLGSGEPVRATAGQLLAMPDGPGGLANGVGVCADTLRRYGTPAAQAPFGFGFYSAPDEGSVRFLHQQLATQPRPSSDGEGVWAGPAQFYDPRDGAGNPLRSWEFSPLDVTGYCTDANNPWCLTAAFLRCPTGDGADAAEAAAITACRTWNANVIILNQYLALTLITAGVGMPADGSELDAAAALTGPGAQAPLDAWLALLVSGASLTQAVQIFAGVVGAGVLIGGLIAGGLPGLLLAAGVIGTAAVIAGQGLFGAVSCAQDLPRCIAAAGADGLVKTLGLIPAAVTASGPPDMTGPAMVSLLGAVGGVSADGRHGHEAGDGPTHGGGPKADTGPQTPGTPPPSSRPSSSSGPAAVAAAVSNGRPVDPGQSRVPAAQPVPVQMPAGDQAAGRAAGAPASVPVGAGGYRRAGELPVGAR